MAYCISYCLKLEYLSHYVGQTYGRSRTASSCPLVFSHSTISQFLYRSVKCHHNTSQVYCVKECSHPGQKFMALTFGQEANPCVTCPFCCCCYVKVSIGFVNHGESGFDWGPALCQLTDHHFPTEK